MKVWLVVIELTTCGHFIHMEQPEMFNEKLKKLCIEMKPQLIIYGSHYGSARRYAERLAEMTGLDITESINQ